VQNKKKTAETCSYFCLRSSPSLYIRRYWITSLSYSHRRVYL